MLCNQLCFSIAGRKNFHAFRSDYLSVAICGMHKMPFSRDYYFGRFKPIELEELQAAYVKSCEAMARCPITSPQKDEMAREIIQIYECGVMDAEKIAELMVQIEAVKPRPLSEQMLDRVTTIQPKIA